jgi:hypothetical protein
MFISWNLPKKNLRLIQGEKTNEKSYQAPYQAPYQNTYQAPYQERPSQDSSKKSIIDDLNLKYKPIESYNAFSNFLPKKKI